MNKPKMKRTMIFIEPEQDAELELVSTPRIAKAEWIRRAIDILRSTQGFQEELARARAALVELDKKAEPHACSSPELDEHCSGCTDPHSEGTHAGCTIEHSHVGCALAGKQRGV